MSAGITAFEAIAAWLDERGFDGLTDEDECFCKLDGIAPCQRMKNTCVPGYLHRIKLGESYMEISTEPANKEIFNAAIKLAVCTVESLPEGASKRSVMDAIAGLKKDTRTK